MSQVQGLTPHCQQVAVKLDGTARRLPPPSLPKPPLFFAGDGAFRCRAVRRYAYSPDPLSDGYLVLPRMCVERLTIKEE